MTQSTGGVVLHARALLLIDVPLRVYWGREFAHFRHNFCIRRRI